MAGVLVAACAAIALALAGSSAASGTDLYDIAVSPNPVAPHQALTVTVTNDGGSQDPMGSATVTLAGAGLTGSVTAPVTTNNENWDAQVSGDAITLTAHSGNEVLLVGDSVSVQVVPTNDGSFTTSSNASTDTGNANQDFSLNGSEASVTVQPGPVASFAFGDPAPPPAAGRQSTMSVTALDAEGNQTTESVGTPTLGDNLDGSATGCGGACAKSASLGAFAADGTATITFTAYTAESGRHFTVTAGGDSASSQSNDFAVAAADVDHFEFGAPNPGASAGAQSTVAVTARDAYGNRSVSNLGSPVLTSNLDGSSVGCGGACSVSESLSSFAADGTATITFTAYEAEPNRNFTITANATSTSGDFTVDPAAVDHFEYGSPSPTPMKAGAATQMSISAFDKFENPSTVQLAPVSYSTTMSPSPQGCPGTCTPSVSTDPFDANGVSTVTFTGYVAETGRTVTVKASDGKATASPTFNVVPAAVDHFEFTAPSPTPKAGVQSTMSVTSHDQYENLTTDSLGTPTLTTNLEGSNLGCPSNASGPCVESESLSGLSSTSSTGTITFKAYKAEGGRTVSVSSGANSASSTFGPFAVAPGAVDHFEFAAPSPAPKAGVQSTMSVTSYDQYENLTTDSLGTPTLTTNLEGSNVGCGGPCPLMKSLTWLGASSTGTITFTAYKAEDNRTVTVTSGGNSASNTFGPFAVAPNQVHHFEFGTPTPTPMAGVQSTISISAFDQYENLTTDSLATATLTTTFTGHNTAVGCGAGNSFACTEAESFTGLDASHSTGTISFTPYVAETAQTVSMKAANNAQSTSTPFDILPNKLDHFTWTTEPPPAPTAGDQFNATAKAFDQFNNLKTNYNPTSSHFTLTGLNNSPSTPAIFGNNPPGNQAPNYGTGNPAWVNGVLTMTNAFDKKAETTKLTVTNTFNSADTPAGVTKDSTQMTVAPATAFALAFTQQPLESAIAPSTINGSLAPPGVKVQEVDTFGNFSTNPIAMSLTANPGGSTLGGTLQQSPVAGTATFANLTLDKEGVGYQLTATAVAPPPGATATKASVKFIMATAITTCTTACSKSATKTANTTLTVSTTGTTGSNELGIALIPQGANGQYQPGVTIPTGACPGFVDDPGVVAARVDLTNISGGTTSPFFQFSWDIDKSIVQKIPNNSSHAYDICLGAVWTDPTHPPVPFPAKGGGVAQPFLDPVFTVIVYWAVLPNCTQSTTTGACVFSRSKSKGGDEVIIFKVFSPWDPTPHTG